MDAIAKLLEAGAAPQLHRESGNELAKLGPDLLRCLDARPDGWEETRDRLGEEIAKKLTDASAVARALDLLAVLDRVSVASHPRADPSTHVTLASGEEQRQVSTGLSPSVLRGFLAGAAAEQRIAFYKSLGAAGPWHEASLCLASYARSAEEIVVFTHCQQETKGSGIGAIADGVAAWTTRHPALALDLVRRRRLREGTFVLASARLVQVIVEALARSGGLDPDARTTSIEAMLGEFGDEPRSVAMALECFAWAPTIPVEERHHAVLERLLASPVLAMPAMQAFVRDAYQHGTAAMTSAAGVLRLAWGAGAPGPVRAKLIAHAAEVAAIACRDSARTNLTAVEPLLTYFLEVPPSEAGRSLDSLLAGLLTSRHGLVREFLEAWLSRQLEPIPAAAAPLQRLLPQVSYRLGPVREAAWLTKLLCHASAAVRATSAALLGADERPFPLAAFNDVRPDEAIALAHEVAGHAQLGVRCIEILFSLARAKPEALETIVGILSDELSADYPGACRKQLATWSLRDSRTSRDVRQRLSAATRAIERRLDERFAAHRAKIAIPEVTTIAPTVEQWQHAEQRAMDRAYRAAYRGSFAAMIATNITICRGSSTSMMGGVATPLQEVSFGHEYAFVGHVDPIGAAQRRFAALVRAERLRQGGSPR